LQVMSDVPPVCFIFYFDIHIIVLYVITLRQR